MNTGTYTQFYGSIVNPSFVSFTITSAGTISGSHAPAAVYVSTGADTLINFGTVSDSAYVGVEFTKGGAIVNGSTSDTSAYIGGYTNGVSLTSAGTVTNFATIQSTYRDNISAGPFGYTNADNYHTGKIGFDGIYLHSGGDVTNSGTKSDIYGWAGVESGGGNTSITNAGTIAGYSTGIYELKNGTGLTINNSGLIHSRVNQAIMAYAGHVSITNTGTVLASGTVAVYGSFGYVGNRYPGGIYVGSGVSAGASVTNGNATNSTALIKGYAYGINVYETGGATITNWATIAGIGTKSVKAGVTVAMPQVAIEFSSSGSAADRVIDEPGATFVGLVNGGGAASVLELASASSAGTVSGIGTQFAGFGTIAVDTGATWRMAGANMIATDTLGMHLTLSIAGTVDVTGTLTLASGGALSNSGIVEVSGGEFLANIGVGDAGSFQVGAGGRIDFTSSVSTGTQIGFLDATGELILGDPAAVTLGVSGFVHGDQIDLPGVSYDTGHMTATYASGQLSVYDNRVLKADIHVTGLSGSHFTPGNDGGGDTEVTAACYCRGTRVLTPDGEVAVEDLAIGDKVVTLTGEARPIRWIGRRAYDGRFIAGKREVLPICITAGALAEGVPSRDLWLSPAHSLYIDGVLVLSEHLVNGATILQAEEVEEVEYFHIELDTHDVIFADGAAAETFVDCDNRMMFANAAEYAALYPKDERPCWEFCLPRLEGEDEALTEIRAALLWRAAALGHDVTLDPDLHLIVDGCDVSGVKTSDSVYRFETPAGAREVWLASRITVPTDVDASARDARRLGVPVQELVLHDADTRIEISHRQTALSDGFHDAEAGHRWTTGLARLPQSLLGLFDGGVILEVRLAPSTLPYRLPLSNQARTAAA
jgi:hypothetical protein